MKEAALVVTMIATTVAGVVAWRHAVATSSLLNLCNRQRQTARRRRPTRPKPQKRVSFSESSTVIHHLPSDYYENDDDNLTDEDRRALLCWSPAELREFARSMLIDEWIAGWGQ
ncbi:unnamed protein product [Sphacelaria rigidula]